jgi:hypothetical protein
MQGGMTMKIRKILASLGLALVLILTSVAAFAAPPEGMFPPPGMPPMMGPAMMGPAMATDKQHLYVLAGPKITQFSLGDLKLLKSVDLPKPSPPKEKADMPFPPPFPPMGGTQGLLVGDGSLYVLAGPMLFQFSTPDLALKTTAELPKPELPGLEQPSTGK